MYRSISLWRIGVALKTIFILTTLISWSVFGQSPPSFTDDSITNHTIRNSTEAIIGITSPKEEATLSALQPGRIERIEVKEGDFVKKDDFVKKI